MDLSKHRRKVAALVIIFLIGLTLFMFLDTNIDEGDKERKLVIDGGVIGGPVQIGSQRINVVNEEEVKKKVTIENGSINPTDLEINSGDDAYFQNLDRNEYNIDFLGERKNALLRFNQSYHIKFNSPGTYNYIVYNDSLEREGLVIVTD